MIYKDERPFSTSVPVPSPYLALIAIALIFLGESVSIVAEMISSHSANFGGNAWNAFFMMFLVITVAGALLIAGYILGFSAFRNIWIVSVTSIVSILIMEPLLAYLVFRQLPTLGAAIGLILGMAGLVVTLVVK